MCGFPTHNHIFLPDFGGEEEANWDFQIYISCKGQSVCLDGITVFLTRDEDFGRHSTNDGKINSAVLGMRTSFHVVDFSGLFCQ